MSPLEQDTTKKEQLDKKFTKWKFETGNSKQYKVNAIWDRIFYGNETENHLSSLYYLIVWKKYPDKKNT